MPRLAAFLFLLAGAAVALGGPPGEQLFKDSCAGCHTIGGGDGAGPDLLASTKRPHADLEAAIKRMEDNVGPLTDEQVDSLVAYLTGGKTAPPPPKPKGSPDKGRRLFFGETKLANGGSPCFACHTAGESGGSLAVDLTTVFKRRTETGLLAATAKPGFPMMKAAYAQHPVTEKEALDLVAFLEASANAPAPPKGVMRFHMAALSFAGVMLGGIAFLFRFRRAGVRSRLVRQNKG
jgi:mono/diheme cytochrome c family protein